MAIDETQKLLTNDETADLLGVSPRTLESWRVSHPKPIGPKFLRIGRQIRYRPADLAGYMTSREVVTVDDAEVAVG